jgi:glucose-6-phosphate dehydrogenase assembly protein OpcA
MDASSNEQNIEKMETGQMKPFDQKVIERELRDLWKEKNEEQAENKKQSVTRACVLNLLIYEENADEVPNLIDTIIDITKHHPSRVVLMSTRANSLNDNIQAEVSAICHYVPGRGKHVCAEQVHVSAEGEAVKRLAATVMPLFVSDLPVTLWWRGVPVEGQPFKGLIQAADRVIIDSEHMSRPTAFLPVLSKMVREKYDQVAFSDVNWSRLTQLRSHIAGLFDVPDLRGYLGDLSKLSIEYPSSEADKDLPSVQTMMLLGWFGNRLRWNTEPEVFQSKTGTHLLKYRADDREITVDLIPSDALKGQDLKVTLTMTDSSGWQIARILINRAYDRNAIETKLETPTICWLKDVSKYEMPAESELLSRELDILGHDTIYEGALEHAAFALERI